MLGSEVDKLSKILIKTLNVVDFIESDILKHCGTKNKGSYHVACMRKHTYRVPLKEFFKLCKCLGSSSIHTISKWLDLIFKALHRERKRRKEIIPTRLAWAPRVVIVLPLFRDIWYEALL